MVNTENLYMDDPCPTCTESAVWVYVFPTKPDGVIALLIYCTNARCSTNQETSNDPQKESESSRHVDIT